MATYTDFEKLENLASGQSIEKVIQLVRIAESAERWEDMCLIVNKMVEMKTNDGKDLDSAERNLLSAAYKHVVGNKRQAGRMMRDEAAHKLEDGVKKYMKLIEDEIHGHCDEIIEMLTTKLIKLGVCISVYTVFIYTRYICTNIQSMVMTISLKCFTIKCAQIIIDIRRSLTFITRSRHI